MCVPIFLSGWSTARTSGDGATLDKDAPSVVRASSPFSNETATISIAVSATRRSVCSFPDPETRPASIVGQDGGFSVEADGVIYWIFGDTTLTGGRSIPNSIATSTDRDGSDCLTLAYKEENGSAVPLLPVSGHPDEATVWPLTLVPAVDGRIHFFYASVARTPWPFAIRFIGLASFDTGTLTATRLGGDLGSGFWPSTYNVTGVHALVDGDYVYVYLLLGDIFRNEVRLARVPREGIEDVSQYRYWDQDIQGFAEDFAVSDPLFAEPFALLPASVSWNDFLGRWTMVYAGTLGTNVSVRTADAPWGPWSEPQLLFDCRWLYLPGWLGTRCYAASDHPELRAPGSDTLYVTVAGERTYRLYLHEVKLASLALAPSFTSEASCSECVGAMSVADYGIASVYVSNSPGPALAPIHRWLSGGDVQYAASSPGEGFVDDGLAFYARLTPDYSVWGEPVYRWDGPAVEGGIPGRVYSQVPPGPEYVRGPVAFYAPCPSDTDGDGMNDCRAAIREYDPEGVDSDGDGCSDGAERMLGTDPSNPWDFLSVPIPALLRGARGSSKDGVVAFSDAQAIFVSSAVGTTGHAYLDDVNGNGMADGMEYDRALYPDGSVGPPDGWLSLREAQAAYLQAKQGYRCD